jgi:hypothetical protein
MRRGEVARGGQDSHLLVLGPAPEDGADGVSHAVVGAALRSKHVVLVDDGRRDEGGAQRHAEVVRKISKDGAQPLFGVPCLLATDRAYISASSHLQNRPRMKNSAPEDP